MVWPRLADIGNIAGAAMKPGWGVILSGGVRLLEMRAFAHVVLRTVVLAITGLQFMLLERAVRLVGSLRKPSRAK